MRLGAPTWAAHKTIWQVMGPYTLHLDDDKFLLTSLFFAIDSCLSQRLLGLEEGEGAVT